MVDALVPSKIVDTEGQLVEALREGSETLQNITDMFAPLMKNFRIYFFWEQEKMNLKITKDYVMTLGMNLSQCTYFGAGGGGSFSGTNP